MDDVFEAVLFIVMLIGVLSHSVAVWLMTTPIEGAADVARRMT